MLQVVELNDDNWRNALKVRLLRRSTVSLEQSFSFPISLKEHIILFIIYWKKNEHLELMINVTDLI